MLPALLPDLLDELATPLNVSVLSASPCSSPSVLPSYSGRPSVNLTQNNAVVARGYRQRWFEPGTHDVSYCAFMVVVNLCAAPSSFRLGVRVPDGITHARHQFDANYDVRLQDDGVGGGRVLVDIVPGYGTSVLRLGCPGFSEACDDTQRV